MTHKANFLNLYDKMDNIKNQLSYLTSFTLYQRLNSLRPVQLSGLTMRKQGGPPQSVDSQE